MIARPPRYWTAARTHYRKEIRAAHHIERQGFKFYLPMTYETRHDGSEGHVLMFPGFIFVKLHAGWQTLVSTRGVKSLMLNCGMPAHVLDNEIAWLHGLEDRRGVVRLGEIPKRGDSVRALEGVCNGFIGLVRDTTADGRLKVLFEVLGRHVSTEYSASALKVVAA